MSEAVTPPGWPESVAPPGAPGWERTAVTWLLDLCPPDYRLHQVVTRHPLVLARFARWHVEASIDAARRGLSRVRADLRGVCQPETVEAAVVALEREGARLSTMARATALVEDALRGRRFIARL